MSNLADLWIGAALEGLSETATMALGIEAPDAYARGETLAHDLVGTVISLQADVGTQVGLFSSMEGCEHLARCLLASSPDDPPLSEEDTADALGEVLNITVGAAKSRMDRAGVSCKITLPVFVHGYIVPHHDQTVRVVKVKVGKADAELFVAVATGA